MPAGPIRILVADDSAEFRKTVRLILALERDVEIVGVARDGQEAVEMAQKLRPDVAVMDINMPRLDGLSAIRIMARVSPATLCMIMSSEAERDQLRQALAAGVKEYLLKPFSPEEFVAAVRRLTSQARKTKELIEQARSVEAEREKYLLQLVQAYLRTGRMDDEAARVYAVYVQRPRVDPNLLARLAEIFCARRDWRTLRLICERLEKLASPPA